MLKTALLNSEYSISDVYDDAAIIGKELEKIIANYGTDIIKDLMPKVIGVLELLENLIMKGEREYGELNELKARVNILEAEKVNRLNEKEKFDKELEEIEDKWKQETLKLIDMVNKLSTDNKRLQEMIVNSKSMNANENQQGYVIKKEELDYIKQIKEENIKLKDSVKYKDREIGQKNGELELLQSQLETLSENIQNFRRKQILAQNQIQRINNEKAEIECQLKEKEHQFSALKQKHDTVLLTKSDEENNTQVEAPSEDLQPQEINDDDFKDPNRPRYTFNELQEVLLEKNELKEKLIETQEQLEMLKSDENPIIGEVQGPINREPDEKTENKKEYGIRRL